MKIEEIVKKMSLKDKIAICSGKNNWQTKSFKKYGIPKMMMSDGPHGLRKQGGAGDILGVNESIPATCFPTAVITACSYDEDLLYEMAKAIAIEAATNEVGMVLGPGINIKRNPLCGRSFEYFSEDPFLAGKLGAAYIRGANDVGIGTSLKHFACNNQEYFRMASDSIVDERALREIYLYPFEIAVKEGNPSSVMCAYNKINGTYCSENRWLLTDVLRKEWGFEGGVVTDWTAIGDRTLGFQSGCDLAMPGGSAYGEKEAYYHVKNGVLDEQLIDNSVHRVLSLVFKAQETLEYPFQFDVMKHHQLAYKVAVESAVLLKNQNKILPLSSFEEVCIIGSMAEDYRYQGYGSSHIRPTKVEQVLDLLSDVAYAKGYERDGTTNINLINEAIELAKKSNKVVIFAGLPNEYEVEGFDRDNLKMPEGQVRLIDELCKVNENIIVVLCCGGVVEIPWEEHVSGILYMGLSGQAGAKAAVDLLLGHKNPSGRLAETWPKSYEDCVSSTYYSHEFKDAQYRESIFVGYRYYDKANIPVRFKFGEGLSYTTFAYTDLKVSDNEVYITVTNTGKRAGAEVVQLYIQAPQNGIYRPLKELKGFNKVYLEVGESERVHFTLDERSFAIWQEKWVVLEGDYLIMVGGSPDCLPLKKVIHITGESLIYDQLKTWYGTLEGKPTQSDFEKILGRTIEESLPKVYDVNSTLKDIAKESRLVRLLYRYYERDQAKKHGRESIEYRMMMKFADESILRSIQNFSGIKGHFAQALADIGNKEIIKAMWHFIRK